MSTPWQVAGGLLVGFAVGSVNPAVLLGRALGRDIRTHGSGNPGATNAGRVLGAGWGVLVGVLDVLKGLLPTAAALAWVGPWAAYACGLGVVLGHMFSPALGGRGGKGVATALGAILAIAPAVAAGAVVAFALVLALVRVVGAASVLASLGLVVIGGLSAGGVVEVVEPVVGAWLVLVAGLVLLRHQRNIKAWWRLTR